VATRTRVALVRQPESNLADGEVTHIERSPVDLAKAREQWLGYIAALHDHGWSTIEVEPAPGCADSVFVEDAAVVHGRSALLCRPGVDSRRAEVSAVGVRLAELGYRIGEITAPGTLDGGDVMQIGATIYIGLGGRTNAAGIAQAAEFFAGDDATVVTVPNTRVLHLKSAVTALPDGRVIGYEPVVEDPAAFDAFIAMPEESGAHVVNLGDDHLLMSANCPQSQAALEAFGYTIVPVDISEYEKLEGCVTCLSIRLRDLPSV